MRRKLVLAVAVVVAGGGATVAYSATRGGDVPAAPRIETSTARLQRQDLAVTETFDGTLGYGEPRELVTERAGVVTSVAEAKATVAPGGELFRVDFEPTVLLAGDVPAYRALDASSSDGPDIRQLEQALVDAGHGAGVTVDEDFTSGTAAAVARWEKALGRAKPDGRVELGDVIFQPGAVRVSSVEADKGTRVQTASTVLKVTPTTRVVEVGLEPSRADDLEPGIKVLLTMPDDTETTGTVASVGAEEDSEDAEGAPGAQETIPVVVTLDDQAAAGDFESGSVDVAIERSREDNAIVAPVTALVALAEGGYAVQLVDKDAPGGYRLVAVEVGTNTTQLVSVKGEGIEAGVEVVVPK
ncbi:MAG TPA: peptidoglycan-binding protein [Actinomycetota bacterium]|nr:peptidoglycan-binding protein [Actinomycetota bacterium]